VPRYNAFHDTRSRTSIWMLLPALLLAIAGCAVLPSLGNPYRLIISVKDQQMALIHRSSVANTYAISTGLAGVGETIDSGKTPRGLHAVAEKIGAGTEMGALFVAGLPTGEVVAVNAPGRWPVVTRLFRLRGLEEHNKNTMERLIYLHGSPVEILLGSPVSGGCIRMRSSDIVPLFDKLEVGTEVLIVEGTLAETLKKFGVDAK
jgi:lipoprotein-anchoring transpeptidase ErfK/SrfK